VGIGRLNHPLPAIKFLHLITATSHELFILHQWQCCDNGNQTFIIYAPFPCMLR
jgi:hypothetical protein